MVNLQALADACEALFYERMMSEQEREAAYRRCAEGPTATRVFRSDWTEVTMPLTYLEQQGETLLVRSQFNDSIQYRWEPGSWREASTYLAGEELETRRPYAGRIR